MIIFLYGEDIFRSSEKLKAIKDKFLKSDPAASGLSVFDFTEKNIKTNPLDVISTGNLLSPKRLVIIKNILASGSETGQDEILDYFKKNQSVITDQDLVTVFWEAAAKKSNKLFKFLEKNSKCQNFEKLSGPKLNNWIMKKINEINPKDSISKEALEKLILYVGNDTLVLDKEIQKLVNYADQKTISELDVEKLVNANLDSNIFNTIDVLALKNKREALKLLHRHIKKGEDPFYLFSMFIYQFRNLLKIADYRENQGLGEREIASASKLHPFVVRKSLAQIQNFSLERLKKIYQKLASLDLMIKTGKIDIKLALDKFIVEL